MIKPNYDNSIINLTASVTVGMGAQVGQYPPLMQLPPATIAGADQVVVLIVDGLGDRYIRANGGWLTGHLLPPLTSVFPSSTAPAITSLMTGVAPQQHGVTGWFMLLRELGGVALLLPWCLRGGGSLAKTGFTAAGMIAAPSIFDRLEVESYFLIPQELVNSSYSQATAGRARRRGFQTLSELPTVVSRLINKAGQRCLISVYWPKFDALCHTYGVASTAVRRHYEELMQTLAGLMRALRNSNTLLIVTADHGFIDTEPQTAIALADHPELQDCLALPLCGEPRVAYCHLRANQTSRFERYASDALAPYMDYHRSEALIEAGWFGLGEPSPQLRRRIGDYVLIARDNYVIYDRLDHEAPWSLIGVHGGLSAAEMWVPLAVMRC